MSDGHPIVCEHGVVHTTCFCPGKHTYRTMICKNPDHEKENSTMDQPTVTPEGVAATAPDETDEVDSEVHAGAYDLPQYDEDHGHSHDEPPAPNAICAFVVVVDLDGNAFATAELDKVHEIVPARPATLQDFRRAATDVVHDVNAMQISQQTVAIMQQTAAQAAEQARSAALARQLQERGLKVPGRG